MFLQNIGWLSSDYIPEDWNISRMLVLFRYLLIFWASFLFYTGLYTKFPISSFFPQLFFSISYPLFALLDVFQYLAKPSCSVSSHWSLSFSF
jgi:hypothetical protein